MKAELKEMKKYQLRFNTQHKGSNLRWRLFEDGRESLAEHIHILVPCFDESTQEGEEVKWNIACMGTAHWDGGTVTIK